MRLLPFLLVSALTIAACTSSDAPETLDSADVAESATTTSAPPSSAPSSTVKSDLPDESGDTTRTTPTTDSVPSSTTVGPTTTTSTPSTSAAPESTTAGIDAWSGTFLWTEFAAGDPGSDATIVHELILTGQAADGSLTGTLAEYGFQTNVALDVAAYPGENGITVFAVSSAPPIYNADDRLFALSGDPDAPITSLGAVQPYLTESVPESGTYFTR